MKNLNFLFICLFVLSCSQKETKNETDLAVLTQQVIGSYEGVLHCVDCISIEYQIEINSDSSFIEHITYLGREDGIFEVHGTWKLDTDSLLTIGGSRIGNKLKILPDWTLKIIPSTEKETLTRIGTNPPQQASLNDSWVLKTLNKIDAVNSFNGDLPKIEFNDADKKISGFGGCNQINGSYQTVGNQISIGPLISTRKACKGADEILLLEVLQQITTYKIIDRNLYLFAGTAEKARFEKVD